MRYSCYLFSLGSMVQNGKFSAGAEALVNTLKKVDFLWERGEDKLKLVPPRIKMSEHLLYIHCAEMANVAFNTQFMEVTG